MWNEDSRFCISIEDAAKALNIGRSLAYELAREGKIPTLHLGKRRIVVPRKAIERMIENAIASTEKSNK